MSSIRSSCSVSDDSLLILNPKSAKVKSHFLMSCTHSLGIMLLVDDDLLEGLSRYQIVNGVSFVFLMFLLTMQIIYFLLKLHAAKSLFK